MTDAPAAATETTPQSEPASSHEIYTDLVRWAQRLPVWENELIRRVTAQSSLSDDDVRELADAAISEHEQQTLPYKRLTSADFPVIVMSDHGVKLTSVGNLRHVNALQGDQVLTFGGNLTIVYGDNGSGKSGYGRLLKRIFRARVVEEILPDLRSEESPGLCSAQVFTSESDEPFTWSGDVDLPESFARFWVLDGECSRTYVGDNNELCVAPEGLDIPKRAIVAIDQVNAELQARAAAARPSKGFLEAMINQTPAGQFVQSLSSATTQAQVDTHTRFTAEDARRAEQLTASIAQLRQNSPTAVRMQLTRQRTAAATIGDFARQIEAAVSDEMIGAYRAAVERYTRAGEATQAVRDALAEPGVNAGMVGSDPWKQMLVAAIDFAAGAGGKEPTLEIDGKCALCWQELDGEARERLERFCIHMSSRAEQALAAARTLLDEASAKLRELSPVVPESITALGSTLPGEFAEDVATLVSIAHARATAALGMAASGNWDSLVAAPTPASTDLDAFIASVDSQTASLGDEAAAAAELTRQEAELRNLATRKQLSSVRGQVTEFIEGLRTAQQLDAVAAPINSLAYSKQAKALETTYRTKDFEDRFATELDELHFAGIAPEFVQSNPKGRSIVTPVVSKALKNIKADKVFSEGECTAISLASFLAEMDLTGDTAGLIFDDPISSLDHNYTHRVADRLVAESNRRQVIVFTHDLGFFKDLQQAADEQRVDCQVRTIVGTEWTKGNIVNDEPHSTRKFKTRVGVLKQLLVDIERAGKNNELATLNAKLNEFYDELRSAWERFIQERMFNNTVRRLERNISPGSLTKAVVTDELIEKVSQGYNRACGVLPGHDHEPVGGQRPKSSTTATRDLELLLEADKLVEDGRSERLLAGAARSAQRAVASGQAAVAPREGSFHAN